MSTATGAWVIEARRINARLDFNDVLRHLGGITKNEADNVAQVYLDNGLAKMDAAIGKITVKHGALLDRETIRAVAGKIGGVK